MTIVAQNQTETNNDRYELFKIVEAEDANGNTVNVKQSIGVYTLDMLNNQKASLTQQIAELDEKITAINNM